MFELTTPSIVPPTTLQLTALDPAVILLGTVKLTPWVFADNVDISATVAVN
jgi:hypothetical protein